MISLEKAREIAQNQNSSTAEGAGIELAIKSAAQLGGYSASYTFPIDFDSANLKDNLDLLDYAVTVSTARVLGVAASYTGQEAGMTTDVTITADENGTAGNSIILAFNGVLTISAVLAAWNLANPSNTASLISGNGAQVPDNSESITLLGGVNAVAEIIAIDFGPQ